MRTYTSLASDTVGLLPHFLPDFNKGLGFLMDGALVSSNLLPSETDITGDGLQSRKRE